MHLIFLDYFCLLATILTVVFEIIYNLDNGLKHTDKVVKDSNLTIKYK